MKIKLFDEQPKIMEHRFPFAIIVLKGLGQIMLQECAYTGIFFLAGIFYSSNAMGFAALLATCCGTITAQLLGYDKAEIAKGVYGFSAALVGVALTFYFEPVLAIWFAVIIGAALATIVQHWFIVKKIPVFTLPFILVTWLLMYLFENAYSLETPTASVVSTANHDFAFALRGFGQVIFQGSVFAGIAFFIGVFVSSPIRAIYGLVAALISGILSTLCDAPTEGIMMGLFSYNALLCAIVFAGNRLTDAVWAFIAVVLSLVVVFVMNSYQLTPLTFPFVVATCTVLILKNAVSKWLGKNRLDVNRQQKVD